MAREYGISGFCHYHYWFEGKQLLETPTNLFLGMKDLDLSFCLSWANETWSRRWDGQEHQILQLQTHTPSVAAWGRHFDYLIKAWTDPRALRIDGKPIFMIYRPDKIEKPGEMFDYWQSRARANMGSTGSFFVAVSQYKTPAWEVLRHYDAVFRFQPAVATVALADADPPFYKRHFSRLRAMIPRPLAIRMQSAIYRLHQPRLIEYDEVWRKIVEQPIDRALTTLEGAFVDWDNTARYGKRATIYQGAEPERFQRWLERLTDKVRAQTGPRRD